MAGTNPGMKYDNGKPMPHLIEPAFLLHLAAVLTHGASKYGTDNWKNDLSIDRILSAAYRHLLAYQSGELTDPETGLPHLSHCTANLMFLHYYTGE